MRNISNEPLWDVHVGLFVDADVGYMEGYSYPLDDVSGFLDAFSSAHGCGFVDTFNLAWTADNDGDPVNGVFTGPYARGQERSATGVLAAQFLRIPEMAGSDVNFNWWNTSLPP
jgi:hypothetical protein